MVLSSQAERIFEQFPSAIKTVTTSNRRQSTSSDSARTKVTWTMENSAWTASLKAEWDKLPQSDIKHLLMSVARIIRRPEAQVTLSGSTTFATSEVAYKDEWRMLYPGIL